jgi:hypothetical protein
MPQPRCPHKEDPCNSESYGINRYGSVVGTVQNDSDAYRNFFFTEGVHNRLDNLSNLTLASDPTPGGPGVGPCVGPEQWVAAKKVALFVIDTETRYSRLSCPFPGAKEFDPGQADPPPALSTVVFRNVAIVDVVHGRIVPKQAVVVRHGQITQVGPSDQMPSPDDCLELDGRGRFLIPGLWDMHTHWYEQARREVRRSREAGADFIKVYSLLSREAYFAIADEAEKLELPFVGHVPDSVLAHEAADAGQKSIEHFT